MVMTITVTNTVYHNDRGHDDMIRHGDDDADYTFNDDRCHDDMEMTMAITLSMIVVIMT